MASAANILKRSTNLTGLAVSKYPHHSLGAVYKKIRVALEKLPQHSAYRKYTEQIIEERNNHVMNEKNIQELEKKIGCGQIEEVILQAEKELHLVRKMGEWKAWEPLTEEPPENQWKWPI